VRVFTVVPLGFYITSIALPAWAMLIYWAFLQFFGGVTSIVSAQGCFLGSPRRIPRRGGAGQALRAPGTTRRAQVPPLASAARRMALMRESLNRAPETR
jgi:hypothetical protein